MSDKPVDVDAYIVGLPPERREIAGQVRAAIRKAEPRLVEVIRYGMPAFQLDGATVVHFAVWTRHVGLYPVYRGDAAYEAELAPWRSKTDAVSLPFSKQPPPDLIRRIVRMQIHLARDRRG